MPENRSKSARVRAIHDRARTRRARWSAQSAESGETYPDVILLGPWIIAVDSLGQERQITHERD
jgi:hypothetical protein